MKKLRDAGKEKEVVDITSNEHAAILAAQHKLESAVALAAIGREREWAGNVLKELRRLRELLSLHCRSVEKPDGLLSEIQNAMLSVNERLTQAREYHPKLLKDCDDLLALVEIHKEADSVSIKEIRKMTALVMMDLRHHQACEADLIFEAFERDVGLFD